MTIGKKQIGKRFLAGGLALCIGFVLALSGASPVYADDKQKELEAQKIELQKQLEEAQQQLNSIQGDKADAEQQKALLQTKADTISSQIGVLVTQISDTQASIQGKQDEIDEKQAAIDDKQSEMDGRWDEFRQRMAAMQQMHDGGAIAMLSSATNLYELLSYQETLTEILDKDDAVLSQMEADQSALKEEKQALESAKAELEASQASLQDQQTQLTDKKSELAVSIQQQDSNITAAEAEEQAQSAEVAAKQAAFDEAANQLDAYLQSLIKQTQQSYADAPISCSLNFICPLSSYTYVSCQYGANGHLGVDLAAPANTEIHAVAGGVVSAAAFHSSYGNYVMVYHGTDDAGNSYATLYAHMIQTPSVSAGQTVNQGDVLGYVGSTGYSFGNHLHLELRVNGARTNPLNYVPH